MDQQRRKKVVKTTHADVGQPAASRADVIRPHKRVSGTGSTGTAGSAGAASSAVKPTAATSQGATQASQSTGAVTLEQFINSYMASQGSLTDTVFGSNLPKREASVRNLLSIPSSDPVYLAAEVSVLLAGKVALALCESGVRLRDLSGKVAQIPWKNLKSTKVSSQGTTLVIGSYKLAFHDAAKLAGLLTQIQSKLAL